MWELVADGNGPLQSYFSLNAGWRDTGFNGRTFAEKFSTIYFELQPTGSLYLSLNLKLANQIDYANTRDGDLVEIDPTIRYNLGKHLRTVLSHTYQKLDVKSGTLYTANLTQLSTVYQFNVRTFLRAILQYTDIERNPALYLSPIDKSTEALFSQLLFSYKLNPQTVLFVGYSDDSLGDERIDLTRADRTLFLKVGYAWVP